MEIKDIFYVLFKRLLLYRRRFLVMSSKFTCIKNMTLEVRTVISCSCQRRLIIQ